MSRIEFRQWNPEDAEVRAVDGDGMTFMGYAARFNSRSEYLGFYETIAPGAFTRTLKSRNEIKAFLNHNSDIVLGSTRAGTLRLEQDDKGLLAEISLPNSEWGRSVAEATRRGDISGMSFGFTVPKNGDDWDESGQNRTLREIALHEVSPVTGFPAYTSTSASVRSLVLLAKRFDSNPDDLESAVDALLAGERLGADAAQTLRDLIAALSEEPEAVAEEIVQDAEPEARIPLQLMKDKLDTIAKGLF